MTTAWRSAGPEFFAFGERDTTEVPTEERRLLEVAGKLALLRSAVREVLVERSDLPERVQAGLVDLLDDLADGPAGARWRSSTSPPSTRPRGWRWPSSTGAGCSA